MIEVTSENRNFLKKAFGVSERTIYYALCYSKGHGNSAKAKKIRHLALQRGGREMAYVPTCETLFDADGKMTQHFTNGAVLVIDKNTKEVCSYRPDGVLHDRRQDIKISDLMRLQQELAAL